MIWGKRPASGITAKCAERRFAAGSIGLIKSGRLLIVMDGAVGREVPGIQRRAAFAPAQNVVDVRRGGSAAWDRTKRIDPQERGA